LIFFYGQVTCKAETQSLITRYILQGILIKWTDMISVSCFWYQFHRYCYIYTSEWCISCLICPKCGHYQWCSFRSETVWTGRILISCHVSKWLLSWFL